VSLHTSDRLDAARAACAAAGLEALLLSPGSDLRYLTGYPALSTERLTLLVLPVDGPATLVVPRLERPAAEASPVGSLGVTLVDHADGTDPYPLVAAAATGAATVGLANRMWAEQVLRFGALWPAAEQGLTSEVLRDLRMRKGPDEVDALRRAGQAIDRVHARMGEWLRVGRTESEVGADIAAAILAEGHVGVDFTIVGSGPNGASPHHELSDRVVQAGDLVVVDIGGETPTGYRSDCTRTYVVGGSSDAGVAEWYAVLQAAQEAATAAVRPGVTAEQIDAAARDLIDDAGWGKHFIHRTGHGIGLDTHEAPYIVAGNDIPLEPGMAFSVEPGIYLPGRCGARIEDIVVCTEDGVRPLNDGPRELVELPG
jgi:Xaa-Pro aminopeptidase